MSCINNEALSACSRNEIKSKTERESRISFVCYKSAFSVCVHSCAMCSVFGLKWANGVRKVYSQTIHSYKNLIYVKHHTKVMFFYLLIQILVSVFPHEFAELSNMKYVLVANTQIKHSLVHVVRIYVARLLPPIS